MFNIHGALEGMGTALERSSYATAASPLLLDRRRLNSCCIAQRRV
jgi:hypothetical protein